MKIYISADMEGLAGVTNWNEVTKSHPDYKRCQQQMTAEVRAACEGAFLSGAEEIWIKDAHASGRNLIHGELPEKTRLISGWSGHPFAMVQELDDSFDAVFFIGYHSGAGSHGNPLAHTMSSGRVERMWINTREVSEFLLHGFAAASLKVPVVLVTGDEGLEAEVQAINSNIRTVAVKKGVGDSTVNKHPQEILETIRLTAAEVLRKNLDPCILKTPSSYTIKIRFVNQKDAFKASFFPDCSLEKGKVVVFKTSTYFEVMRFVQFVV